MENAAIIVTRRKPIFEEREVSVYAIFTVEYCATSPAGHPRTDGKAILPQGCRHRLNRTGSMMWRSSIYQDSALSPDIFECHMPTSSPGCLSFRGNDWKDLASTQTPYHRRIIGMAVQPHYPCLSPSFTSWKGSLQPKLTPMARKNDH